jgi:hypothetical protein
MRSTKIVALAAALSAASACGGTVTPRTAATTPPSTRTPVAAPHGEDTCRPMPGPPAVQRLSLRLFQVPDTDAGDTDAGRVFEVVNGGELPEYRVGGTRPAQPIAWRYSDYSIRGCSGELWSSMRASDGGFVRTLIAALGERAAREEAQCHLTPEARLQCRDDHRVDYVFSMVGGTVFIQQSPDSESRPLRWRVEPAPVTAEQRRQALHVFWFAVAAPLLEPHPPL